MAVLNIRDSGMDEATAERIKLAAASRGWAIGRYVAQLAALHEATRARADAGDKHAQRELTALGLETQRR